MLAGEEVYSKLLGKVTIKKIDDYTLELEEIKDTKLDRKIFEGSIVSREEYLTSDYTKEDLLKSCKLRHIKYLYHITTLNNLKWIVKKGIVPRSYFITNNGFDPINLASSFKSRIIHPEFPDEKRLDKKPNCSSFSISKINEVLLNTYRKRHKDYTFCALRLPIEVVVNNLGKEYFFYHNASLRVLSHPDRDYKNMRCFNLMFYKSISVNTNDETKTYDRVVNKTEREYTTSPQAEIMINNIISPRDINQIIFFDDKDKESFASNINIQCDWIDQIVLNI